MWTDPRTSGPGFGLTVHPDALRLPYSWRTPRLVFDDDRAVARLGWLAQDNQAALDQACDVCPSYTDVDLGIRGRAIGLLARVLYPDLPADPPLEQVKD